MKIELFPLEKMVYDNKDIFIGAPKEDVIEILGDPESIQENYGGNSKGYYYEELCCDFDKDDKLEAIEFLYGHDGSLKPYIYGVSAFDVERKELLDILKEHNNGEIDEENEDSYTFNNISVGVWKDSDNDDENDYWTTILIGKKDYYNKDSE